MLGRLTEFVTGFLRKTPVKATATAAPSLMADSAPKTDTVPQTEPVPATNTLASLIPLVARSGAQGDSLKKAQDNLIGLRTNFTQDVQTWKALRDALTTQDKRAEHASVDLRASYTHSRLGLIQRIKEILLGLIESPDVYLRDHLKPSTERVRALSAQFDKLVVATENDLSPETKHAEKIEVCNISMSILECFNEMINITLDEINYWMGVGHVGEKILQGAVTYAVSNVPFGALDVVKLNLEPLYRDQIYKRIHEELDKLSAFMIQVGSAVNDGKRICVLTPSSRTNSLRASSFFVMPVEEDKAIAVAPATSMAPS